MDTVLLAVKQTTDVIQEADGGVRYLTSADFGGSGGGTIPTTSTQIETSYGNALTTTAEWTIGDTLRRTRVLDLTTDPISEVSVDWFNERTQLNLTVAPIIDTDVEIQTTSTVETGTGLATEYTLERLRTLVADNTIYGQVVTGMAIYWNVEAKSTLLIDIKGSGTMATAPVLQYLRADGTWAELSTLDSTYTALTTSNNQFKKVDCSALQQVRLVFGTITGNIYLRLRASVAKAGTVSGGGGGGDASAANQVIQNTLLTDIANYTASSSLVNVSGSHIFTTSSGFVDIDVTDYATLTLSRQSTNGDAVLSGIFVSNNSGTSFIDSVAFEGYYMGAYADINNNDTSLVVMNVAGLTTVRIYIDALNTSTDLTIFWELSKVQTNALRPIQDWLSAINTLLDTKLTSVVAKQSLSKVTCQTLDITGTSNQSAVVNALTTRVSLVANVNCWVEINDNPTATVGGTSFYLPAGVPSYPIDVVGGFETVAVIADSASGKLSIFESR